MAISKEEEIIEQSEEVAETEEVPQKSSSRAPLISNINMILITGFGMAIVIIIVMLASGEPA